MRIFACLAFLLATGLGLSACKSSRANAKGGVLFPARVTGAGEEDIGSSAVGTMKMGDGQRLVFDLQRTPIANGINLWACWDMPSPATPLGRAVCVDNPAKNFEVTANYVDLLCRTSPDFGVASATADVDWSGCAAYKIFAYAFESGSALQVIGNK